MIRKLQIRNFKSIKAADLNCKRVNVFIGEPNTGKSNVLESIALLHLFADRYKTYREDDISLMLRISQWNQLFYDQDLSQPLSVTADKTKVELRCNNKKRIDVYIDKDRVESLNPDLLYVSGENLQNLPSVKFALYRFRGRNEFTSREANFIAPPDGPNMIEVIRSRKELMEALQSLLSKLNLNLVLDITGRTIRLETTTPVGEGVRETLYLPYSALSESLRRMVFNLAVVLGNRNMVIALDTPEAHMYPPHVKKLAELIAHDKDRNNQYFITTYSPYLLMSLIEKTPKDELNVFLTYKDRNETKVKTLANEQIEEILDMDVDVFFNLDKFLEKGTA
jgi:AAA15 family ATPase/GTPase